MKKKLVCFLALLLAIILCGGCAPKHNTEVIILRVGDKVVTRREYRPLFLEYYSKNPIDTEGLEEDEIYAKLESLQNDVFNTLLQNTVLDVAFEQKGLELTEAERTEIEAGVQEKIESDLKSCRDRAEKEGAEDTDAEAKKIFQEQLSLVGYASEEEYRGYLFQDGKRSILNAHLFDVLSETATLSEAEAKQSYEADLTYQEKNFPMSIRLYADAMEAYESGTGLPPAFIPEGFTRLKHILVTDETLANELYTRLQEGEDFEALLDEYGQDLSMSSGPEREKGYLVSEFSEFLPEFKEVALSLKEVGDISKPLSTDEGYYIMKLVEKVESRRVPFEEIRDDYMEIKLKLLQVKAYSQYLSDLAASLDITSYIGRIRDIGRVGG